MLNTVADAAEGLAYEHSLFTSDGPQVGLWTARARALVCPHHYDRKPGFDAAAAQAAQAGFPVHLRPTGGGTVPQGPGSLNLALSFHAPLGFTIDDGYALLTEILIAALGEHGAHLKAGDTPGSFCDGTWNLSAAGRKIVGTAQRWRPNRGGRPRVLAHALILVDAQYQPGAAAVADFHNNLGLHPIDIRVHTSLRDAFGLTDFPNAACLAAAQAALARLAAETPPTD